MFSRSLATISLEFDLAACHYPSYARRYLPAQRSSSGSDRRRIQSRLVLAGDTANRGRENAPKRAISDLAALHSPILRSPTAETYADAGSGTACASHLQPGYSLATSAFVPPSCEQRAPTSPDSRLRIQPPEGLITNAPVNTRGNTSRRRSEENRPNGKNGLSPVPSSACVYLPMNSSVRDYFPCVV